MRNAIKKILKEVDEWDWVSTIEAKIPIQPETIYYAEPPLTNDEAKQFINLCGGFNNGKNELVESRIINENLRLSFVAFDKSLHIAAWCTITDISTFYGMQYDVHHYKLIDIRTLL